MRLARTRCVAVLLCMAVASGAGAESLKSLRWRRRVLLIAAPSPADTKAVVQGRIFAEWSRGAAARDVSLVQVSGSRVTGASDRATSLRERYHLKAGAFEALLIGKDGHVALRSSRPIAASALQGAIDAMPMRQAGER